MVRTSIEDKTINLESLKYMKIILPAEIQTKEDRYIKSTAVKDISPVFCINL